MIETANLKEESQSGRSSGSIVFKGYKSGLTLIIPENGSFEVYLNELKSHLEQAKDFFRGAKITLKIGNRQLLEQERTSLLQLIEDSGMTVQRIVDETEIPKKERKKQPVERESQIPTIAIRKTIRSGQRMEFDGHLLIMGDVNPGGEVVASGDIIVLGKLRGIAHAGAKGEQKAEIFAFQMKPVQIRIAGIFTRAPEKEREKESRHFGPEVAKIREGQIVVEKVSLNYFNQKYKY